MYTKQELEAIPKYWVEKIEHALYNNKEAEHFTVSYSLGYYDIMVFNGTDITFHCFSDPKKALGKFNK